MMIWPPSAPSSGLYAVWVRSTGAFEAAGADAGACDPAGGVDGAVPVVGAGVAAPWHAANTIIVLPSRPTRRFRIKTPPIECVSPHLLVADRRDCCGPEIRSSPFLRQGLFGSVDGRDARAHGERSAPALRVLWPRHHTLSNCPWRPSGWFRRAHL